MAASPASKLVRFDFGPSTLYRSILQGVILAGIGLMLTQAGIAQYARKPNVSKGPRALGLMQLAANGKAHLIPITIMLDSKFYDAGAYKAAPVPMALEN